MQKPTHKDWLFIAKQDLEGAKRLAAGEAILSPAFFLTQQVAEKSLKGYLLFQEQELTRTHDLALLLKSCARFNQEFLRFVEHVSQLGGYLTNTRYPDDMWYVPDESTLHEAIGFAEEIFDFVAKQIATAR